ncbi:MAG: ECF-type sigma factor [Planctomycetota bacterium]|jgi:RNA polymerase sigma factor (TIGR02999 family)
MHDVPEDERNRSASDLTNPGEHALTRVLQDVSAGRADAAEVLLPFVYEELQGMARRRMRAERADHTLQATALVNESYLRLVGDADIAWENRAHFFGAAARAMQRILVEHARARSRKKRSGDKRRLPLNVVDLAVEADLEDVLAVQQAVERLGGFDPRLAEIVRLRFYAGLGVEDTARAMGLSVRTVRRDWTVARAWLARELGA